MNNKLYMPKWNELHKDEKIKLIEEVLMNKDIPLKINRVETFTENNMTIETVVLGTENDEDTEFVFVPGMNNVILGWDENCVLSDEIICALKEDKTQEIEYYKSQYEEIKEEYEEDIKNAKKEGNEEKVKSLTEEMEDELENYECYLNVNFEEYIDEFKNIIVNSSSPVRNVNISPMIVERDLNDVSEYDSYSEFRKVLKKTIFSLPNEDEYEYLLTGGSRTLFRWGNSLKKELDSIYKIGTVSDENNKLYKPNKFGLYILFDSYMYELVDDECFYKGGDGGCSLCGGEGAIGVVPVFSTFYRPDISEDMEWEIDQDYCYYRRIIRIS